MNHRICRVTLACLLLATMLVISVLQVWAEEGWVQADGTAPILRGAREAAQGDALRDAQRNAVQQVLGAMISSETLVENFALIKDRVLQQVEGYVRKFELLGQSCNEAECTARIRAQVERIALADDVAALAHVLPQMNFPSIVVSFAQKSLGQNLQQVPLDLTTVEQVIAGLLSKKGFRIVEASALESERLRQASLMEAAGNSVGKAIEAAAPTAQVVIAGQAVVQDNGPSPYNERIHSYGAFLTGKAYESVTGRMLASGSAEGSVPHQSFAQGTQKAAQKAAEKLTDTLAAAMIKGWLDACYNEHEVELVIEGISFAGIDELKSGIAKAVRGVRRVTLKSFLKGRAELTVGWQNCNTQRLAQQLDGFRLGDKIIRVVEAQGNIVRVILGNT